MFIHTLTFLNISKSSPSKSYLAYLIPNLCFIIQSSCTHFSLRMQYMNCASILHTLPYLPLSLHMSLSLTCTIISLFMFSFKAFLLLFFLSFFNIIYQCFLLSFLLPLRSALFHSGFLSFRSPCLCRLIPQGSLLISAVILPLALHLQLTCPQLYFFSLFKLFIVLRILSQYVLLYKRIK